MSNLTELVLASHNQGKLRELQNMLGDSFQIHSIGSYSKEEPEETGLSFVENAIIKARHAAEVSGLPSLADDSGIMVDVLQGEPGIYSARYAGNLGDEANIQKLLKALENTPEEQRTAQFVCALVLVRHAKDPMPIICEGVWKGRVLSSPQGSNGFGYDPIFWIEEQQCSCAEMPPILKNRISHRAQALELLKTRLQSL